MLHIILLIWKNSKHYNTPARLVVLMREICNSLIIQACKYSSGEQIFTLIEQEDAAKAVDQLKTTLLVCGTFKSTYFDYKATANAECPANPWRIQARGIMSTHPASTYEAGIRPAKGKAGGGLLLYPNKIAHCRCPQALLAHMVFV